MPDTTNPERTRSVEEAPSYGVGHRFRIEISGLLNAGTHTQSELSRLLHLPLSTISHHIKEMLDAGCIEVAKVERVRNVNLYYYRAIELPEVSDEEAAKLPTEIRQEYAAVILQAIMAESMGALWAGHLSRDPVSMLWRWFNLDEQGQRELLDELRGSWQRVFQIEADSFNRIAKSGEQPKTMIVSMLGYERSKPVGTTAPAEHRAADQGKT